MARKLTENRERRTENLLLGVISDTHSRIRPSALKALRGSDVILHAGDIGTADVIAALKKIAPVHAIHGNIDREPLTNKYPATEVLEFAGLSFYMLHNLQALDLNPKAAGFAAVIYGHSHKPEYYFKNGVLYFNPGSAGPKRFSLPISVGKIRIREGELLPEIILLDD
ncbi:MAG: metallophosphoesterase family protein [Acidobacteriaceae bacterium]